MAFYGIIKPMAGKRFRIYDIRTGETVAWAGDATELLAALSRYSLAWHEALDTTTDHRVGILDGKIFDRDAERYLPV